jgi:hypothetical protein
MEIINKKIIDEKKCMDRYHELFYEHYAILGGLIDELDGLVKQSLANRQTDKKASGETEDGYRIKRMTDEEFHDFIMSLIRGTV